MPDFTFIKHGSGEDPELSMTFSSDSLETVRNCFEDFVRGSGFVVQEETVEEDPSPTKLDDWEYDPIFQSSFISPVSGVDSISFS